MRNEQLLAAGEKKKLPGALLVIAKIIRVLSVPPILIGALLAILWFGAEGVFPNLLSLILSFVFLALLPMLAYPVSFLIPALRRGGRESQREAAFVFSLAGYLGAVIYGLLAKVGRGLLLLYFTYFLSLLFLLFFNKVVGFRASGHACGITGPLVFPVYFVGWQWLIPCLLVLSLVCFSSLVLKRHTGKELAAGSGSALAAFFICLLFFHL